MHLLLITFSSFGFQGMMKWKKVILKRELFYILDKTKAFKYEKNYETKTRMLNLLFTSLPFLTNYLLKHSVINDECRVIAFGNLKYFICIFNHFLISKKSMIHILFQNNQQYF